MRTTLDVPDSLFRRMKADAARRGITLKTWLREAVHRQLGGPKPTGGDKPWMQHAGKLSKRDATHLRRFVAEADFNQVDPGDLP